MARTPRAVMLEVRDNGRGFATDAPRKPHSLGLMGLRERAQLLKGSASIDSAAGAGHARAGAHSGRRERGGLMIRIVIADDHAIVREGLKRIVSEVKDMQVVGEAADGTEVMQRVRELEFDMLVLDLSMPGRSGMELIKLVHAEKPKLRILVLSMHQELQYAVRAIKSGASGYLTKESAPAQLEQAIRKIAGGGAYVSAEVAEQLALGAMPGSEGHPHETLVGPRVRGVPAAGGRRVGHRHRHAAEAVGEDRQHAQGQPDAEDGPAQHQRADPLRDQARRVRFGRTSEPPASDACIDARQRAPASARDLSLLHRNRRRSGP